MANRELQPYDRKKLARNQAKVEAGFWETLRHYARRITFLEDAAAAYYAAFDRNTPIQVKAILFGALAYFILPLDAIPDFAAALGFADDAAVLFAAIRAVSAHVTERHRAQARQRLDGLLGPKKEERVHRPAARGDEPQLPG